MWENPSHAMHDVKITGNVFSRLFVFVRSKLKNLETICVMEKKSLLEDFPDDIVKFLLMNSAEPSHRWWEWKSIVSYAYATMVYLCVMFYPLVFAVSPYYAFFYTLDCMFWIGPKFHKSMNRSIRINHAFRVLQYRFKDIQSFQPMTRYNVTLDDDIQPIDLHGYRILLNHCPSEISSIFFILFSCLLSISLKIFSVL